MPIGVPAPLAACRAQSAALPRTVGKPFPLGARNSLKGCGQPPRLAFQGETGFLSDLALSCEILENWWAEEGSARIQAQSNKGLRTGSDRRLSTEALRRRLFLLMCQRTKSNRVHSRLLKGVTMSTESMIQRKMLTLPLALLVLILVATGVSSAPALGSSASDVGFRYAKKAERQKLKRQTSKRVKRQKAWFISRQGGRWAVVCGKTRSRPRLPGMSFRKKRGRWVYSPPKGSGGMQTITFLCSDLR